MWSETWWDQLVIESETVTDFKSVIVLGYKCQVQYSTLIYVTFQCGCERENQSVEERCCEASKVQGAQLVNEQQDVEHYH